MHLACPLAFLGYKPSGGLIGRDLEPSEQLQKQKPFCLKAVPNLCRRGADCRCQTGSEQLCLMKDVLNDRQRIAYLPRPVGEQLLTNGVGDQSAVSQPEHCQRLSKTGK